MDQASPSLDPVFPGEIFNLIIKELYAGNTIDHNRLTIKICSLVCRDFVPLCQPYLFQEVEYDYAPSSSIRRKLVHTLTHAPQLSNYIRSVQCKLTVGRGNSKGIEMISDEMRTSALQTYFPNIHSLTFTIKHECFQLSRSCECYKVAEQALQEFTPLKDIKRLAVNAPIRGLLPVLLKFPNIQFLSLQSCVLTLSTDVEAEMDGLESWSRNLKSLYLVQVPNFPASILTCLRRIEDLEWKDPLRRGKVAVNNQIRLVRPERVISFDNLRMVNDMEIEVLSFMCSAAIECGVIAFPSLRYLKLEPTVDDIASDKVYKIFNQIRGLEDISLVLYFTYSRFSPLNLVQCVQFQHKTLKHIKIFARFRMRRSTDEYGHAIAGMLADALESIRGANIVESIDLCINVLNGEAVMESDRMPSLDEWAKLDHVLMENRQDFLHLRRVKIDFNIMSDRCIPEPLYSRNPDWFFMDFLRYPLRRLCSTTEIEFQGTLTRGFSDGECLSDDLGNFHK